MADPQLAPCRCMHKGLYWVQMNDATPRQPPPAPPGRRRHVGKGIVYHRSGRGPQTYSGHCSIVRVGQKLGGISEISEKDRRGFQESCTVKGRLLETARGWHLKGCMGYRVQTRRMCMEMGAKKGQSVLSGCLWSQSTRGTLLLRTASSSVQLP